MEQLLTQVTRHAMTYAIRTGISITSGYAIKQCGRLLRTVEGHERDELEILQVRLEGKIKIIAPAIDMIELIAARGNTSLESAVTLTKSLRWEIQSLGVRLSTAVGEAQLARKNKTPRSQDELEIKLIIGDIKKLLGRIEDAVPLINLAITTSGVNLSTTLPATVSPSRLLQASTFLTAGDTQYNVMTPRAQQIGPAFTLSMYMLFAGHAYRSHQEEGIRDTTWKEVMHKARVTLLRVPLDQINDFPEPFPGSKQRAEEEDRRHVPSEGRLHEFAYQLLVVEDHNDGRAHEEELESYQGVERPGIREIIPIHEISKIFYADTGKILNIGADGETNNPILLLKRDVNAVPPRRMMERNSVQVDYDSDGSHTVAGSDSGDEQSELDAQLRCESTAEIPEQEAPPLDEPQTQSLLLPPNLDLEWMAFEVFVEESSSDSDDDDSEVEIQSPPAEATPQRNSPESPGLTAYFSKLDLRPSTPSASTPPPPHTQLIPSPQKKSSAPIKQKSRKSTDLPAIKTSLSLLEMLIRLTALQQFQQTSHLAIPDEFLTFFLSDSSTVGSGGDSELRRRARREARMRVGFDPYDESPIKRRGEEYLQHEFDENEQDGYNDMISPGHNRPFDYEGYPQGRASTTYSRSRSRSSTPLRSPQSPVSSPLATHRSKSSADVPLPSREPRHSLSHLSSASPLLRRATTQPGQNQAMKQPSFRGPPTAPPTSSSPRMQMNSGVREAPATPPSSSRKQM